MLIDKATKLGLTCSASLLALALASGARAQGQETTPPTPPAAEQQTAPPSPPAQLNSGASAPASANANAAPPGTSALTEVVVTAQRRAQNLQRVPLAVTSLSPAALATQQIVTAVDIARVVPNMFASNNVGQGSANVYYIRGLGQTNSFPTFEPQVATYIDDIYIGRQNANNFALFGVEQLQVLRGPQGTLFGRNSTGGAVLVTLQRPTPVFGGFAEVSYGSWNRFMGRASVDLPINDQIRTSTSVFGITDDGWVENLTTHETMNKTHNFGVREAVLLKPANMSNVEWYLSADYADNDQANILNYPGPGGANGTNRVTYTGFSQSPGALTPFLTGAKANLGQGVEVKTGGIVSNLKVGLDAGTLNVISGYRFLNQATAIDFPDADLGPAVPFDQTSYGQFNLTQELRNFQFSQEFKFTGEIGRLNYTAGLFYFYETNRNNFAALLNLGPLFKLTNLPVVLADEFTKNQTISQAGYIQGDYRFTDQLTLTLGGRFTHEIKTLQAKPFSTKAAGFTDADIRAAGYDTHLDTDQFTPRIALQYQWTPQVMLFASATHGFQGGGWNGLAFNAQTFNNFGPETVWSYEGGFRSETPDRRLRLNGTFFYTDVSGYQLLSDLSASAGFVTNNAADLRTYGAEFDAAWRPVEHLTVTANLGLINAEYTNPSTQIRAQQMACAASPVAGNTNCGNGIVNPVGRLAQPTYTPKVSAATTASYDLDLGGFTLTPTVGVQYYTRQTVSTAGLPQGYDPARALLDLGVTLRPAHGAWSITAECKNCTMEDYGITYLFGYRYYNIPGQWDVRLSYKF